jgi:hypothetical protein
MKAIEFFSGRQRAEKKEIGHFFESGVIGQIFYGISTIAQAAFALVHLAER